MRINGVFRSTSIYSKTSPIVLRWRSASHSLNPLPKSPKALLVSPKHRNPHHLVQIQSNSTATAYSLILAATFTAVSLYIHQKVDRAYEGNPHTALGQTKKSETYAIMSGKALPGRPGNLTADQEAKLQEIWTATLSIFGIPDLDDDANDAAAFTTETTATMGSEKKKKKRMGMFSRKNHDDGTSEKTDATSVADGDDKFGQAKAYRKLLETQSPEEIRATFWSMVKHDDPDGLLLRFLRARKWNVQNALVMLIAAMHWRLQEMHVDDDIIKRGEGGSLDDSSSSNAAIKKDAEDFLAQMRLGKSFLHGTDREGRPMCFVRVRLHKQGEQTESSVERYTVYTIETARYLLSSNVDTAVSSKLSSGCNQLNVGVRPLCST